MVHGHFNLNEEVAQKSRITQKNTPITLTLTLTLTGCLAESTEKYRSGLRINIISFLVPKIGDRR